MNALAVGLAAQLALAGTAKGLSSRAGGHTLVAALWPRVPVAAFVAGDAVVAALLLWPATMRAAALLAAAAIAGFEVLAIANRDRGTTSCGCFGSAQPREGRAWREHAVKAVMVAEAAGALLADPLRVPAGAALVAATLATAAVLALVPEMVAGLRPVSTPTRAEALRALARSPRFAPWRPAVISALPAEVRPVGNSVRIVLDAWSAGRPVVLVGVVSRFRVRLRAYDAGTLARLG